MASNNIENYNSSTFETNSIICIDNVCKIGNVKNNVIGDESPSPQVHDKSYVRPWPMTS